MEMRQKGSVSEQPEILYERSPSQVTRRRSSELTRLGLGFHRRNQNQSTAPSCLKLAPGFALPSKIPATTTSMHRYPNQRSPSNGRMPSSEYQYCFTGEEKTLPASETNTDASQVLLKWSSAPPPTIPLYVSLLYAINWRTISSVSESGRDDG